MHSWCDLSTPHYSSKEEKQQCAGQLGAKGIRGFRADSATKDRRKAHLQMLGSICLLEGRLFLQSAALQAEEGQDHLPSKVSTKLGRYLVSMSRNSLPSTKAEQRALGELAPLTRLQAAGGAVPALPSMPRSWAGRNVPGARPAPAPAAARAAERWRTAAPTCVGRKHCGTGPGKLGNGASPSSSSGEELVGPQACGSRRGGKGMQTCPRGCILHPVCLCSLGVPAAPAGY